ncbi:hypothetical protein PM082_002066 [Marasmius tenuissimus]|nr:hypothetical protein PM082_002066 [Marasmius tenuissimus]
MGGIPDALEDKDGSKTALSGLNKSDYNKAVLQVKAWSDALKSPSLPSRQPPLPSSSTRIGQDLSSDSTLTKSNHKEELTETGEELELIRTSFDDTEKCRDILEMGTICTPTDLCRTYSLSRAYRRWSCICGARQTATSRSP